MKKQASWLIVAAAFLSSPSAATQWGSYHWANDGTGLTLHISHAFKTGADWQQWYNQALADWGRTSNTDITLIDDGNSTGTSTKKCNPIAGKALVCSDAYGQRGWLGIASIWANGDHITQATTKLNDSYFGSGSSYDAAGWRDLVACQEIGHDFGLDHQDETFGNYNLGTCMDYTNAPDGGTVNGFDYGPANRQPNGGDYASLTSNAMYGSGHNDGTSGGGGGGGNCNPHKPGCTGGQDAFTFREVGKAPQVASTAVSSSWGAVIGHDAAGRPNTFYLSLGNGRAKLTHVLWKAGFHPTGNEMHD